ncbi:MAG: TetR family transcriptional regulator [Bacteroidetes bacterium]|jgi:AcrR family transcriptional regulator|nr:TetR family transcriptional regulator [Bacteroidota bacterium]
MDQGIDPSIDEVAEEAMVSRTTAYRYFSNIHHLILEASLAATLDVDAVNEAAPAAPSDVPARAGRVQTVLYEHARENEVQFRLFLSSANKAWVEADGEVDLRSGRRLAMMDDALGPVRDVLDTDTYERLLNALAGMVGIESLTMMRDICELDHEEARSTMNWAVQALVRSVLKDHLSEEAP